MKSMTANSLLIGISFAVVSFANETRAQSSIGNPRLMQGPMVGPAAPEEILIWARASGPFECYALYGTSPDLDNATKSEPVTASKSNDYAVTLRLRDLAPDTTYYYTVYVHEGVARNPRGMPVFSVRTAPAQSGATSFRVAFGSCPRWQEDPEQPIWQVVRTLEPDLFFWIGDNIYGDALDPDILAEEYRRQRDVTGLQPIIRSVPQLATWDDHDFGLNDHDRTNPVKEGALQVFKRYWPNPAYGLKDAPGVFFKYSYSGVDFFFLDCRYYRDPNRDPDTPEKTFLGAKQLAWLKEGLNESDAPFKVLVSGSGFNSGKGAGGDSWAAFLHERNALFDYVRDENISGVVLISGDTHMGELNCIPWSEHGGYDLYELVSSPLAQAPSTGGYQRVPEMRIRDVVLNASNVGVLDFKMGDSPTLTMRLINHYGRAAWTAVSIQAGELKNGVESWPEKIDDSARRNTEFAIGGRERLRAR